MKIETMTRRQVVIQPAPAVIIEREGFTFVSPETMVNRDYSNVCIDVEACLCTRSQEPECAMFVHMPYAKPYHIGSCDPSFVHS